MDDKWIKGCFFANVVSVIYEDLLVPIYVEDRETSNGIYFWINGYISPRPLKLINRIGWSTILPFKEN